MRLIYHLVPPETWDAVGDGPYRPTSLETEGFVHCSYENQVAWVANRFFAGQGELLVLFVDTDRLNCRVQEEDVGTAERFPHVHGPIDRQAVVAVQRLERDAVGRWVFKPS